MATTKEKLKTDDELLTALYAARSATDVLAAVAAVADRRKHQGEKARECPEPLIPTVTDYSAFLIDDYGRNGVDDVVAAVEGPDGENALQALCAAVVMFEDWRAWRSQIDDFYAGLRERIGIPADEPVRTGQAEAEEVNGFILVEHPHRLWVMAVDAAPEYTIKHPLEPVVAAWQDRPREIEADGYSTAIMERNLFAWAGGKAPSILQYERHDNTLPVELGYRDTAEAQLMLFGEESPNRVILPHPVLVLAERFGFGSIAPGPGARADKRLLVYSLLRVPQSARRPGGRYTWRPTLKELAHVYLYPPPAKTGTGTGKKSRWKPNEHHRRLDNAFSAVTLAGMVLPDGRLFHPVQVQTRPNYWDLDSRAVIPIVLPEEVSGGAMVRWDPLIAAGVVSDPAFDGELTLAALWDEAKARNGGYRIHATRPKALRDGDGVLVDAAGNRLVGPDPALPWRERKKVPADKPARSWADSRAIIVGDEPHPALDKVPVLGRDDRRRLFYGHRSDEWDRRDRHGAANRADKRLRELAKAGHVVIDEVEGHGWRILEPAPRAAKGPTIRHEGTNLPT